MIILLSLFFIQLLAVILPGPDFFLVVRSSMLYGRVSAYFVSLGISTGVLLYCFIVVFFLEYVQDNFTVFTNWISFFGGWYLFYVAYGCLRNYKIKKLVRENNHYVDGISYKKFYISGLLCNLLNPKCIIFLLSILPFFMAKLTGNFYNFVVIVIMFTTALSWFLLISFIMGRKAVREFYGRYIIILEIIFSFVITLFAISLIISSVKSLYFP